MEYNIQNIKDLLLKNPGITTKALFDKSAGPAKANELFQSLALLEKHKEIYVTKNEEIYLIKNNKLFLAKFSSYQNKNREQEYSLTKLSDYTEIIIEKPTENYFHRDIVLCEENDKSAKIIKLVERNLDKIYGLVKDINGENIFTPNTFLGIQKKIVVPGSGKYDKFDKILVRLTTETESHWNCEVLQVIKRNFNTDYDVVDVLTAYGLPQSFDKGIEAEAQKSASRNINEYMKTRKDLSSLVFVTIDGDDSKDLDDAIYVEKANGHYKLFVAIADVAEYVEEKTNLDKEALERGNSTYLIDYVVPMLPKALSNNSCSLNPNEHKLVMVLETEISEDGQPKNSKVYEAIIKSKQRLTYNWVNDLLNNGVSGSLKPEVISMLKIGYDAYKKIEKYHKKNGFLEFSSREVKVQLNEKFIPSKIYLREANTAEKLIEHFMITANSEVAKITSENNIPSVYRVHDPLKEDLYENSFKLIRLLNPNINPPQYGEITTSKISKVLNFYDEQTQTSDTKHLKYILHKLILMSMSKAEYSVHNSGHFALSLKDYCHFTSPIRRYSDLLVHRMLKKHYFNSHPNDLENDLYSNWKAAKSISETEINSASAEEKLVKIKKAKYLYFNPQPFYEVIISRLSRQGIFVEYEDIIEGLIKMFQISEKDTFVYDDKSNTIIGERTKVVFRIGQTLKVKVDKIMFFNGNINFLIEE